MLFSNLLSNGNNELNHHVVNAIEKSEQKYLKVTIYNDLCYVSVWYQRQRVVL